MIEVALGFVVFMMAYYLLAGTVAVASLGLDLLLLPFGMIVASGFLGMLAGKEAGASALALPTKMPALSARAIDLRPDPLSPTDTPA